MKIPFPCPEQDACSNGIKCPLTANTSYYESVSIPILNEYPAVRII